MVDPLSLSVRVASSGLEAQSHRMRIVSENLANHDSTGKTAGASPYTRKTISFITEPEQETGANYVRTDRIGTDRAPYPLTFDPSSPAADANGNVKHPNVQMLVELADMRETTRAYEANLQVIKQARELISMTIDLLRSS
jgi:flagellar basal-body rod protein FlgC